jgi:hypothetical protein
MYQILTPVGPIHGVFIAQCLAFNGHRSILFEARENRNELTLADTD